MMKKHVPVLTYHALIEKETAGVHFVHVRRKHFEDQMRWLYENGYTALTLPELFDGLKRKVHFDKVVVLTFDDGYYSLYEHAMPVLQRYGFRATLFLTTASVGEASYACLPHCKWYPTDDRPLNWGELRVMREAGWAIEAHGHRHLDHALLGDDESVKEMELCKQHINAHLGYNPSFYCFPYGRYSSKTLKQVTKLGFDAAFGVQPGFASPANDLRRIYRIGIDVNDDLELFERKVRRGYVNQRERLGWSVRNFVYRSSQLKDLIAKYKGALSYSLLFWETQKLENPGFGEFIF